MDLTRRSMLASSIGAVLGSFAAKLGFKAARRASGRVMRFGIFEHEQRDFTISSMPYGPKAPTDCMLFGCGEDGVWHEIRGVTDIEGGIPWKS